LLKVILKKKSFNTFQSLFPIKHILINDFISQILFMSLPRLKRAVRILEVLATAFARLALFWLTNNFC